MLKGINRRTFLLGCAAGKLAAQYPKLAEAPAGKIAIREDRTVLDILHQGTPFAVYNFDSSQAGLYRPYFHPVFAPGQLDVTQNGEFPGSLRGHYWHRGLFIAHQKVNGCSFWEERAADCGRIVHLGFECSESGEEGGFQERLVWRDAQGRDMLGETRLVRARVRGPWRMLDIGSRLSALETDVRFEKSQYNLLACRVPNSMCLAPQKERYRKLYGRLVDFRPENRFGVISNSEGQRDEACGGARARWCDYSGPSLDNSVAGVAILDHPANPRHPTAWHNWNNMTIIASLTYYEPLVLKAGRSLAMNWRVIAHAGDAEEAEIATAWEEFSQTEPLVKEA